MRAYITVINTISASFVPIHKFKLLGLFSPFVVFSNFNQSSEKKKSRRSLIFFLLHLSRYVYSKVRQPINHHTSLDLTSYNESSRGAYDHSACCNNRKSSLFWKDWLLLCRFICHILSLSFFFSFFSLTLKLGYVCVTYILLFWVLLEIAGDDGRRSYP